MRHPCGGSTGAGSAHGRPARLHRILRSSTQAHEDPTTTSHAFTTTLSDPQLIPGSSDTFIRAPALEPHAMAGGAPRRKYTWGRDLSGLRSAALSPPGVAGTDGTSLRTATADGFSALTAAGGFSALTAARGFSVPTAAGGVFPRRRRRFSPCRGRRGWEFFYRHPHGCPDFGIDPLPTNAIPGDPCAPSSESTHPRPLCRPQRRARSLGATGYGRHPRHTPSRTAAPVAVRPRSCRRSRCTTTARGQPLTRRAGQRAGIRFANRPAVRIGGVSRASTRR